MDLQPEDEDQRAPLANDYDYEDAAAGMQDAVERARRRPREERSDLGMLDELLGASPSLNDPRSTEERPASAVPATPPLLPKPNPGSPSPSQRAAGFDPSELSMPDFKPSEPPMAPLAMNSVPPGPETEEADARREMRLQAVRAATRLLDAPPSSRRAPPMGLRDEDFAAAAERDRRRVQQANLSESIRAAFARQAPRLQQEPSETDSLLARRREFDRQASAGDRGAASMNDLLSKALKGETVDPSLVDFRRAQAERWRADNARADAEAKRKAEEAAAKAKRGEDATATEAAEVEGAKRALLNSPAGKSMGLTPEDLADVKTRKGLEPFLRVMGMRGPRGAGKPPPNPENNSIPFMGGTLRPRAGTTPTKEDRKKVQEISSLFGGTFEGMDSLEGALREYATHPSAETKRTVESQVQGVATVLNSAYGQGAMAENEAKNIKEALGADLISPTGVQALVQSIFGDDGEAAHTLLTRLKAARQVTERVARGKLRAYNYELGGGTEEPSPGAPSPTPSGRGKLTPGGKSFARKQVSPSTGRVRWLDKAGSVIEEADGG